MIFNKPVYPIPPSFENDKLELKSTDKYIKYLQDNDASILMTTKGTSQFNLLDNNEIRIFNKNIILKKGIKIIGLPEVSEYHLKKEIDFYSKYLNKSIYFLVLFPERYYNNKQIINFFKSICDYSPVPILAHGNSLRKGNGGTFEYDESLLLELSQIDNFIGIKEESSSIDFSHKNLINIKNLDIIVAGGSMRRFWSLYNYNATSFLTGIGSMFPKKSEKFYQSILNKDFDNCNNILKQEAHFFNCFMKIGWHASMRQALNIMGYLKENRKPFVELNNQQKNTIRNLIEVIKNEKN